MDWDTKAQTVVEGSSGNLALPRGSMPCEPRGRERRTCTETAVSEHVWGGKLRNVDYRNPGAGAEEDGAVGKV